MARIPLYNGGEVPANMTGVRVPMVGQGVTAGTAMGEALMKVGQLGAQVAAEVRKADDSRGLLDAAGIQSNYAAKQQLFQDQNPDQNTWLPQWQKHQEEMNENLSKLDLSSSARKTLDISTQRWSEGQGITVQRQAVKQSGNRAVQAADNAMGALAKVGDRDGILKVESMISDAVMAPEAKTAFVNRHLQMADDVIRGRDFNNGLSLAEKDPRQAISWATAKREAGNFDERQEMMIHDAANAQIQRNRAGLLKNFSDRTSIGNPPSKEELDNAQDLTDLDKQIVIHQAISKPTNDPSRYQDAFAAVSNYDPSQDPTGLKRAQAEASMTAEFSGAYLENLKYRLDQKAGPRDPAKVDDGPAIKLLNTWTKNGGLGSYKTPVLDASGKPVFKEKKGNYSFDPDKGFSWFGLAQEGGYTQRESTYEQQFAEDPSKKAVSTAKQAEIIRKIQDELKIPGRLKSSDEVNARMIQLFQEAGGVAPPQTFGPTQDASGLPQANGTEKATNLLPSAATEGVQKALKILNK